MGTRMGGIFMTRLLLAFVGFILIYSIFYDLRVGTLTIRTSSYSPSPTMPAQGQPATSSPSEPIEKQVPYVLVKVKAGDTVLSLVEKYQEGPLPVSINQVIQDFQRLNENTSPNDIQIGKMYKIPIYKN
jgi:hypothetical protein